MLAFLLTFCLLICSLICSLFACFPVCLLACFFQVDLLDAAKLYRVFKKNCQQSLLLLTIYKAKKTSSKEQH